MNKEEENKTICKDIQNVMPVHYFSPSPFSMKIPYFLNYYTKYFLIIVDVHLGNYHFMVYILQFNNVIDMTNRFANLVTTS